MTTFLLKLLGVDTDGNTRVTDATLGLRDPGATGWALLVLVVLAAAVAWSYWREAAHVSPARRWGMAALRAAFLLLLLGLILQPVLSFATEGSVRRVMVQLVDATGSMRIADPRTDHADLKRAAIGRGLIDPAKGLDQPLGSSDATGLRALPRVDLVKATLTNPKLDLLPRLAREYDLRPLQFGQGVSELTSAARTADGDARGAATDWVRRVTADAPATALGDAVRDTILKSRGQPLAGVFLVTDGQSNAGAHALAAAEVARQENVPLYVWGVGISRPRDVVVANLFAQDVAFLKDQVPVVARVRGTNVAGRTVAVSLRLAGKEVDRKEVTFAAADGEQVVPMTFTPEVAGDVELEAIVDPLADEAVRDNNRAAQRVRVIDRKIRVLVVEGQPRWEFKYLQAVLLRDRRVDAKFVLQEADPSVSRGAGTPYLATFPREKKELFEYDLIVWGDVDPKTLAAGQLEAVAEFVDRFGGGLLFLSGKRHNPASLRGTPLEKLLPVELADVRATGTVSSASEDADEPVKLELTAAGQLSQFMRLTDRQQDSADAWAKLPPIYWAARVAAAKPGAEVLAVDPSPARTATRTGAKMPVIALQQYGLGQALYVGTDNTWRWRRNGGDRQHVAFWGQAVQRLALPHLLGESKRTQLTTDRPTYTTGDRVTVYARLYDATFAPIDLPDVRGTYRSADGRASGAVALRRLPDQKGMYRGEFVAPPQGQYQFWVDRDERTKLDLSVGEPRVELAETAMNEPLLREMARVSGGQFFREEDLHTLPDVVRARADRVKSRQDVDVWSSPAYFLLMLGCATAEWVLRKTAQLK